MAVHDLGRVAGGVRGDGELALLVDPPAGEAGDLHPEAQMGEEGVPQRQQLVHPQGQGQADGAPDLRPRRQGHEGVPLPGVEVGDLLRHLQPQALLALVAGDVFLPAAEAVDGQPAVVGAALAGGGLGGVDEAPQPLRRDDGTLLQIHGVQRRAVGPHEPGDGGANHVLSKLQLKGSQDGVVVEGAPLDHDVLPQLVGGARPDDLVDGVFHHRDGQPRGDVLHGGAVLLGLLHRGVHEHGAPAAQVHRGPGVESLLREGGGVVAHGPGEGLDEGPAPGGAGLVEHDGVDGPVFDLEALDVLAADVQDEVHLGAEVLGGGVVGDGLHHALVHAEGRLDQLLPVAGDGAAPDLDPVPAQAVDGLQLLLDDLHRVAPVGGVVGVEQLLVPAEEGQLGGGAAAVDAQPSVPLVCSDVPAGDVGGGVAGPERLVVRLGGEQRRQQVALVPDGDAVFQLFPQLRHRVGPAGGRAVEGGAQGHGEAAVLREHRLLVRQAQGLLEPAAQALAVVEGAAQEEDLPGDPPALGQAGDGLVDHRLVDAGGHVGVLGPLVEQGLDVRLGEDAAPGGDGVEPGALQAHLVQLIHGDVQQRGHLVDESAGASGAGAVHPLVDAAVEEDDLGVLPAQLDDGGGVRLQPLHHLPGGEDLLDEGHPRPLGQPQAGGPGDGGGEGPVLDVGRRLLQQLQGLLPDLGEVALVLLKNNAAVLKQYDLGGGGANVDAQGQPLCLLVHACHFPPRQPGRFLLFPLARALRGLAHFLLYYSIEYGINSCTSC